MIVDLKKLKEIAEIEFQDIVDDSIITGINEIRIILKDSSFLDIWFSLKLEKRYSFHWERRHIDDTIYSHDNFPDPRWKKISTFPKHFHNGSQSHVQESLVDDDPISGVRQFMDFVRKMLT